MKKIVLICLLLSFLGVSFANAVSLSCAEGSHSSFCDLQEDHDHHDAAHHCNNCGHPQNIQEELKFSLVFNNIKILNPIPSDDFYFSKTFQSLYRPPIA